MLNILFQASEKILTKTIGMDKIQAIVALRNEKRCYNKESEKIPQSSAL